MKKLLFLFSVISTLLISCMNPHYNMDTCVSVYLPELSSSSSSGARIDEDPDTARFDNAYWYLSLSQNNVEIYSIKSEGGRTAVFSAVVPGTYILSANIVLSEDYEYAKNTVIGSNSKYITVLPGQSNEIVMEVPPVPVINTLIEDQYFDISAESELKLYVEPYGKTTGIDFNVEYQVYETKDFYDMHCQWYCDDVKLETVSGTLDSPAVGSSNNFSVTGLQVEEPRFEYSYKFPNELEPETFEKHVFYVVLTNPVTGGVTKSKPVTIYFTNGTPKVRDFTVEYKKEDFVITDSRQFDSVTGSDFSVNYEYAFSNSGPSFILSYKNTAEAPGLNFKRDIYYTNNNFDVEFTLYSYYSLTNTEMKKKFTFFWKFDPPSEEMQKFECVNGFGNIKLPDSYISSNFSVIPSKTELNTTYQWYRYYPETGEKELIEGKNDKKLYSYDPQNNITDDKIPVSGEGSLFYCFCHIKYEVGDYCLNANDGKYYTIDSCLIEVKNREVIF